MNGNLHTQSKKKRSFIITVILYVLAGAALAYFVMLTLTIGPAFRFNYVWLASGLFCFGIALVLTFSERGFQWIPKPCLIGIEIVIMLSCFCFILVEGFIIRQSLKEPEQEADYLIVLGAKVNGTKPSLILQYRIEKAAEYLKMHPDTLVIVSGGKGADEGISEAAAMKNGLIELGISQERIYMEEESTSTKENVDFSKKCMEANGQKPEKVHVVIVTTDFHVLRAVQIAKRAGYPSVEGLAAKSVWYLVPTNYVREFLAVVKDKLVGNF